MATMTRGVRWAAPLVETGTAAPFPVFAPPVQRLPLRDAPAPAPASEPGETEPARSESPLRRRRVVSGVLLAVAAVASVTAAVLVVLWQVAFVPVLSPSMEPAFGAGDLVLTRQVDAADVTVGQVVVLPVPGGGGSRFVHRVVEARRVDGATVVRTKGDANDAMDAWTLRVTSSKVPVVVAHVPDAAALPMRLRGDGPRLALLGLVVLLTGVGLKRALFD